MIEDEEMPRDYEDLRDVIERLDYHEVRTSTRIERLEERVRQLESEVRIAKDSGDADLLRLKRVVTRLFSFRGVGGDQAAGPPAKPFPITTKRTSIGVAVISVIVTAIRSSADRVGDGELLGRCFGVFLFCAGIPAILAYVVAGREQRWSSNAKWFFWGCVVTSLWSVILAVGSVS